MPRGIFNKIKVNDKFGKLTVIKYIGISKKYSNWKCLCECGNIIEISTNFLKLRTCCGCNVNHRPSISINLIGMNFMDLKVIKELYVDIHGRVVWECECTRCNKIVNFASSVLKKRVKKNIRGCQFCNAGEAQIQDISGLKFNRLTVIDFAYTKGGNAYWNCICECGTKKIIIGLSLKDGSTQSCKCLSRENGKISMIKLLKSDYYKSKIENIIEFYLFYHDISSTYSFILDNKFQFDFIVNNTKILIEVHGDFWHSNPEVYLNGPLYKMQSDHVARDIIKQQYARNNGYKIYCIWEKDINKGDFSALDDIINNYDISNSPHLLSI